VERSLEGRLCAAVLPKWTDAREEGEHTTCPCVDHSADCCLCESNTHILRHLKPTKSVFKLWALKGRFHGKENLVASQRKAPRRSRQGSSHPSVHARYIVYSCCPSSSPGVRRSHFDTRDTAWFSLTQKSHVAAAKRQPPLFDPHPSPRVHLYGLDI